MSVITETLASVHPYQPANRWALAWGFSLDLIEQFAVYQRGIGNSDATVLRRTRTLRGFARHLAPADLTTATRDTLEEYLFAKPNPATRHAYRSDLRVFYKWAHERAVIPDDPAATLHSIKVPKRLPRPIGSERFAALVTGTPRTQLMVALGLYAGLRVSEIAALDATDIDLNAMVVLVRAGKGGKDRVVDLHPELGELLRPAVAKGGPLFSNSKGQCIQGRTVSAAIRRHFDNLGITATPHQLRHTFGSELTRCAKGDLVSVAAAMGHESTQTTMGYVGWAGTCRPFIHAMFQPDGDAA